MSDVLGHRTGQRLPTAAKLYIPTPLLMRHEYQVLDYGGGDDEDGGGEDHLVYSSEDTQLLWFAMAELLAALDIANIDGRSDLELCAPKNTFFSKPRDAEAARSRFSLYARNRAAFDSDVLSYCQRRVDQYTQEYITVAPDATPIKEVAPPVVYAASLTNRLSPTGQLLNLTGFPHKPSPEFTSVYWPVYDVSARGFAADQLRRSLQLRDEMYVGDDEAVLRRAERRGSVPRTAKLPPIELPAMDYVRNADNSLSLYRTGPADHGDGEDEDEDDRETMLKIRAARKHEPVVTNFDMRLPTDPKNSAARPIMYALDTTDSGAQLIGLEEYETWERWVSKRAVEIELAGWTGLDKMIDLVQDDLFYAGHAVPPLARDLYFTGPVPRAEDDSGAVAPPSVAEMQSRFRLTANGASDARTGIPAYDADFPLLPNFAIDPRYSAGLVIDHMRGLSLEIGPGLFAWREMFFASSGCTLGHAAILDWSDEAVRLQHIRMGGRSFYPEAKPVYSNQASPLLPHVTQAYGSLFNSVVGPASAARIGIEPSVPPSHVWLSWAYDAANLARCTPVSVQELRLYTLWLLQADLDLRRYEYVTTNATPHVLTEQKRMLMAACSTFLAPLEDWLLPALYCFFMTAAPPNVHSLWGRSEAEAGREDDPAATLEFYSRLPDVLREYLELKWMATCNNDLRCERLRPIANGFEWLRNRPELYDTLLFLEIASFQRTDQSNSGFVGNVTSVREAMADTEMSAPLDMLMASIESVVGSLFGAWVDNSTVPQESNRERGMFLFRREKERMAPENVPYGPAAGGTLYAVDLARWWNGTSHLVTSIATSLMVDARGRFIEAYSHYNDAPVQPANASGGGGRLLGAEADDLSSQDLRRLMCSPANFMCAWRQIAPPAAALMYLRYKYARVPLRPHRLELAYQKSARNGVKQVVDFPIAALMSIYADDDDDFSAPDPEIPPEVPSLPEAGSMYCVNLRYAERQRLYLRRQKGVLDSMHQSRLKTQWASSSGGAFVWDADSSDVRLRVFALAPPNAVRATVKWRVRGSPVHFREAGAKSVKESSSSTADYFELAHDRVYNISAPPIPSSKNDGIPLTQRPWGGRPSLEPSGLEWVEDQLVVGAYNWGSSMSYGLDQKPATLFTTYGSKNNGLSGKSNTLSFTTTAIARIKFFAGAGDESLLSTMEQTINVRGVNYINKLESPVHAYNEQRPDDYDGGAKLLYFECR